MATDKPRCAKAVRFLADYLERRLDAQARAELDAHLARCPECVRELRTYASTVSLLRSLKDDDLPPHLRMTLRSFLDARCHNN